MDPIAGELRGITLAKVVKWVCATVMIFGGVVPYIPQYREIYIKEDAEGFSMYVCLALLIANTLRILFWFGKRYELPLLLQSVIMNILMLAMIHLCVRVRNKQNLVSIRGQEKYFTDNSLPNSDERSGSKLKTRPSLDRTYEVSTDNVAEPKTVSGKVSKKKIGDSESRIEDPKKKIRDPKTHIGDFETNVDSLIPNETNDTVVKSSKNVVEIPEVKSDSKLTDNILSDDHNKPTALLLDKTNENGSIVGSIYENSPIMNPTNEGSPFLSPTNENYLIESPTNKNNLIVSPTNEESPILGLININSPTLSPTNAPVKTAHPNEALPNSVETISETIIGVEHPFSSLKRRPVSVTSATDKELSVGFIAGRTDPSKLFGRFPWMPLGSFRNKSYRKSYFEWRYFWQWTDFQSYLDFLLALSISLSLLTFLCINSTLFVECLGFMAVFTEAMLGVPQLLKNLRSESTEGMSILMVLMWTAGDAFKTVYFVVREAPLQFWICGTLQVLIDITILGQVYWYRNNTGAGFRNDRID